MRTFFAPSMPTWADEARERQHPRRPAAEARVFSRRIVAALARHGVTPQKSRSLRLGATACRQPAVWLGMLDGDGSVGVYRQGRLVRLMFSGTRQVMRQCQDFWRNALEVVGDRHAARPHSGGTWTFCLHNAKARNAAVILLKASPVSMRRKRALLMDIAR